VSDIEAALEHHQAGRLRQAESAYRSILAQDPDNVRALHLLGTVCLQGARYDEAAAVIRRALELKPDYANARNNLGLVYQARGDADTAVEAFREALKAAPEDADIWINLGNALRARGGLSEAVAAYRRALELEPGLAVTYNNLGGVLMFQGRLDEAVGCFQKARELDPAYAEAHSNLFQCMHYSPAFDAVRIHTEARRFNEAHAAALTRDAPPHGNDPDPERRLRIGYVSAHLRSHPVGYFMAPLFSHHDRGAFEVFCYAAVTAPDELTDSFRQHSDHWRECIGLNDQALAQQMRADGIDIAVDLAGHSGGERLLMVFARKPAPVQLTAGGHYDTTGLDAMDYLITDRFHSPEGSERYFSEQLVRMPHDYVCYKPPDYAPAVAPSPFLERGAVTFGCFNNLAKVTAEVVATWAAILEGVPGSRLRMRTRELDDDATRRSYQERFASHGVVERVELSGYLPHRELLAAYGGIDIGLDPFPYSGGLTTCEAMWMGVPVVTRGGEVFSSRHSTSHLSNVGLPELCADEPDAYTRIAIDLANDRDRLAGVRRQLRERMAASPLCDAAAYTRDLESAYREMWRRWCAGRR
jgi:predicted O-linked N-acetylglucosamine transferase (SPINDLY family)